MHASKQIDLDFKKNLVSISNRPNFEKIRVSLNEVELYFTNDYCFESIQSVEYLQEVILKYFKAFFGVNEGNVSDDVIDFITEKMKMKHPTITFSQIKYAFLSQEIQKKEFTSSSTDEFVKYLDFWHKKQKQIKLALEEIEQIEAKRIQDEQNKVNFENSCREVFDKSVNASKWLGDKFQAKWVLSNMEITTQIDSYTKRVMWDAALDKAKQEAGSENKTMMKHFGFDLVGRIKILREQIYAEMLINEILK